MQVDFLILAGLLLRQSLHFCLTGKVSGFAIFILRASFPFGLECFTLRMIEETVFLHDMLMHLSNVESSGLIGSSEPHE